MAINGGVDANDTRNNQEQLAASLIDCLGVDGAIYACQANAWDGVLRYVLPHRKDTASPNVPSLDGGT